MKFPKNFTWGVALSGPQNESNHNRTPHVMDRFYEVSRLRFYDELNVNNDFDTRFREYLAQAKNLHMNAMRVSIQWTRLMPDGKHVSEEAVNYYRTLFLEMHATGIEPNVTLMHFDTPMFEQVHGGWEVKETIDHFVRYADTAFRLFGDVVKKWITFSEPISIVEGGYLYDFQYPNKFDMRTAMQVQFNLLVAHLKTVNLFKERKYAGEIGIVLNITPAIPRSNHPADIQATRWAEIFQSKVFLEPILKHFYPEEVIAEAKKRNYLWTITNEEKELISKSHKVDFIGVSYYTPIRVKAMDFEPNWNGAITPRFYFEEYVMPGRKLNPSTGAEIFAPGLYIVLKNLQINYDNIKTFVAETGVGYATSFEHDLRSHSGEIQDDYRVEFFNEHLASVKQALDEGSHVSGFFFWTLVDNWNWINSYKNRYGLFELDLKTKAHREKKSAKWVGEFLKSQGR